jgi:hypothetical protein
MRAVIAFSLLAVAAVLALYEQTVLCIVLCGIALILALVRES